MKPLDPAYEHQQLARLRKLMDDPRYWREHDKEYCAYVQKGFEDLYDEPSALARAREGEAANELGLTGRHHSKDKDLAHVSAGEIVVPFSAQTADVLNALYGVMGDGRVHYVVGSGYEQRNPVSGLPAFADNKGWFGKAKSWVAKKANDATRWHFEDRDKLNAPLPDNAKDARRDGFVQYPNSQNRYHDNKRGRPESKYAHPDGREVIFDGDTGEVITTPELKGTYNYVHLDPSNKPKRGIIGWADYGARYIGHGIVDVAPYFAGGNVRGIE